MLKSRKKRGTQLRHFDVVILRSHPKIAKKGKVLSLRKKKITLELSRESLTVLADLIHQKKFIVTPVVIIGVVLIAVIYAQGVKADTSLYPTTCLGAWNNSSNAEGPPDVPGHPASDYTDENSASVSNSLAQIFCGSFQGTIPANTTPTSITLTLSWAVNPSSGGQPVQVIDSSSFSSSTDAIINAPTDSSSELLIPVSGPASSTAPGTITPDQINEPGLQTEGTAPTPAPPSEPSDTSGNSGTTDSGNADTMSAPTPAATPASVPADTPAPSAAPAPDTTTPAPAVVPADNTQSLGPLPFFASLFKTPLAYAQEASTAPILPNSAATSSVTANASSTSGGTATSTPTVTDDNVAEVLYTLDGTTWTSLGEVSESDLQNSTFSIPVNNIQSWDDLSKIQISVRTLSNLNTTDTLYLDGMSLTIGYGPLTNAETQAHQAAMSAYRDALPTRDLQLTLGSSTAPSLLAIGQDMDGSNKAQLLVSAPPGPIVIYSDSDPTFSFTQSVGDQLVSIEAYNFLPGNYTLVSTKDPDACQGKTKDVCMSGSNYIASVPFSVTDLSPPDPAFEDHPVSQDTSTTSASSSGATLTGL